MTFISEPQNPVFDRSGLEKARVFAQTELLAQRERLILWMPVFLAIGIGLYFSLRFEPPLFLSAGSLALVFAVWGLIWPLKHAHWQGFSVWLVLTGLFLSLLGFTAAQIRTELVSQPLLMKELDPVTVAGRITVIDKLEEDTGVRLILNDLEIEKLSPEQTPAHVRLKVRDGEGFRIGDRVSVLAGLKPPSAPVAPGAFDFQRYAYFKQIGAFGFTYKKPEIIESGAPDSFNQRLENIREVIRTRIEKGLNYPQAAISTALMTGERTGITEEDWEAMRSSGLAHMLAISGLHVGLVASVVFISVRLFLALFPSLVLRYPIKKYAAIAALLAALGYTLMVGSTIPTIRALMMTGIVLFAIMIDRVPFSLRMVAIAAFTLLLFLPESLFGASFQMSFAAVTCLIFFYEQARPYISQWYRHAGGGRRLLLYFVGVCMTTVIASLATAPFSLFHFQHLALYSLLSNLFAVPLMAFVVMPAAVVSYALMPLGLEDIGLNVMGLGIKAILSIAHGVTDMPLSTWTPAAMPMAGLVLFVAGTLFAILWKGKGRLLGLLPVLFSLLVIVQHSQPDILVSSSGKLIALRDPQGQMWISSRRSERFTAEVWGRRNGQLPEDLKKWSENDAISCDESGCRALWNGRRVAVSNHTAAQVEDCAWADVLIAVEPLRAKPCHADVVIGYFDLWRHGAHAVWADGRVETVESVRGSRPWVVSNRR